MSSLVIPSYSVRYKNSYKPFIATINTSIIVACEFQDGVLIGADSQKTSGEYITNRIAKKLVKINDNVYCSGCGLDADIQFIIDSAIYQLHQIKLNTGGIPVAAATAIFRELCYRNRNSVDADFLIVGWDNCKEEGQVYSISSGGMMKRDSVCAIGSGSSYVYGYVDACYTANMNMEEAQTFVMKTLQLAIWRDNLSGGHINLLALTNTGVSEIQ